MSLVYVYKLLLDHDGPPNELWCHKIMLLRTQFKVSNFPPSTDERENNLIVSNSDLNYQ